MSETATRTSPSGRVRLLGALALTAATIGLLALLPTVDAQASAPTVTVPPPSQVEAILGRTPLGTLNAEKLVEELSQLKGLEGVEPAKLHEALTKLIAALVGKGATLEELVGGSEAATILREKLAEVLGPLASHLEELLSGNPQKKLTEALESAGVSGLLGELLNGSPEPQALIEQITSALGPERLQGLLGTILGGAPFSKTTVEELAHTLGTTPEALAALLGKTVEQLPGTVTALTTRLANGEMLAVFDGVSGITLGVIKGAGESGGVGGPGGGSSSGGMTVTIASTPTTGTSGAPSGAVAARARKLRVISHKVKGIRATVVLEVPSAGKLSAGARGVRAIRREAAAAERVTIHPALTRAGTSSLRRHHRKLKVPVKFTFKQAGGASSSVTVSLLYR